MQAYGMKLLILIKYISKIRQIGYLFIICSIKYGIKVILILTIFQQLLFAQVKMFIFDIVNNFYFAI